MFAIVLVAYVAGALVSAQTFGASTVSAFFPAAGVSVAAMLLTRRALWPAIVAAVILGETMVDLSHGLPWTMAGGFALADTVEPLVGASLVRAWCGGTPDLRRTRDLFLYVIGACVLAPAVGGLVNGVINVVLEGSPLAPAVLQWSAGDGISILVVGASILLWPRQSDILRSRPVETVIILLAAVALSTAGFRAQMPPATLVLPVLAWAAVRLSVLGTALTATVVAFVGNYVNSQHRGLISEMQASDLDKLATTQLFIAVIVLTALIIAQEVSRRRTAVAERDVERGERLRLESLSALAQQLSAALTPEDVGEVLERELLDDGEKSFSLGLLSRDGAGIEWVTAPPVSGEFAGGLLLPDSPIATEAIRLARPVLVRTEDDCEQRFGAVSDWMRSGGASSLVVWPLSAGEGPIGVLLMSWIEPQPFDAEQLAYVSTVSSMAGQALARAQSYADEHARAVVLHAALHPTGPVETIGLEYSVCYEPSDVVHGLGGDWYDIMALPKNRTYFAVGDIVGHGLTAVEDMAQLRSAGRAFAHQGQSPGQLLADLNGFTEYTTRGEFATAVVAIFDHETATLSYCSAGHPPAFLRRGVSGEVIELGDANGPVLGPMEDVSFDEGLVQVQPGDTLVMYTDGLVEHTGLSVLEGISRARRLVAEWPADALLDCKAVVEELAPPPRPDDVCLVVVRFGAKTSKG